MQALPSGVETDFILVSCAGVATPGVDELQQESVTAAKRQGEAALRTSGLSYTVVRPGPIIDEPGGYKALVFDQVKRIANNGHPGFGRLTSRIVPVTACNVGYPSISFNLWR